MARIELDGFEAVSAAVPGEDGYSAAIAVKALDGFGGAPRFHKVLGEQRFKTALAADDAAVVQLELLKAIDGEGGLLWATT